MKQLLYKEGDLEVQFLKGSGPGGQNRNKRETGVRVTHLPTGITAMATERRSQNQNLQAALERLQIRLQAHFHRDLPRIKTKTPRRAKAERLKSKKHLSARKQTRRHKFNQDD